MILNNNNNLFKKIIDNYDEFKTPYDNYIASLQEKLNCYVFIPFFVKTAKTASDISLDENSYSYDVVDKHFQNKFDIPIIEKQNLKIQKSTPIKQTVNIPKKIDNSQISNKYLCEDYLRYNYPFIIIYNGRLIFDSETTDKSNLNFYERYFTLYGKSFPYNGMLIKRK